jgi:hypothetical protein
LIPGYIDEVNEDRNTGVQRSEAQILATVEKKRIDRILRMRRRKRREMEMEWNNKYGDDNGRPRYGEDNGRARYGY